MNSPLPQPLPLGRWRSVRSSRTPRLTPRTPAPDTERGAHLPKTVAAWGVIALWLPYAALNTIFPGPVVTYGLGMALAILGVALLRLSGVSLREGFVRLAPLSRQGAMLLLVLLPVLPVAWIAGRLQPWSPLDDLVYAPASAVAQELYFRASLLIALTLVLRGRKHAALLLQAVLFGLWHLRAFVTVPLAPAAGIILATTVAGAVWGLQTRRDGTMVYAAAQHALFLALL